MFKSMEIIGVTIFAQDKQIVPPNETFPIEEYAVLIAAVNSTSYAHDTRDELICSNVRTYTWRAIHVTRYCSNVAP